MTTKEIMLLKRAVLGGIVCKPGDKFRLIKYVGNNVMMKKGGQEFSVSKTMIAEIDEYGRRIDVVKKTQRVKPKVIKTEQIQSIDLYNDEEMDEDEGSSDLNGHLL